MQDRAMSRYEELFAAYHEVCVDNAKLMAAIDEMRKPPSDRGQGRKPLSPSGEAMKPRQIRMTDAEWAKCMALGGGAWVRAQIKKAKDA
jgi:hypothetical protein